MTKTRRWIFGIASVAGLIVVLIWAFAPRPVAVELAAATVGRFEMSIEEDGKTRLRDRYVVSAPLAGRVSRISLREGDPVAAGMVLAQLTPAMPAMLDARTNRELSIRVETAEAMVARADTRIARTRVALAQARDELNRSERLLRDKFVSAAKVEADRLAVLAAQRELDGAGEDRHVAGHELDQARAALASLHGPEPGDEFAVRAPVSGRVLRVIQRSEGIVALGAPLIEIGDTGVLEVVAELLTTDALQTTPGSPVRIERWGGSASLEGRVREVEPAAFTKISALGVEEQRVNVLIDITSPPSQWKALGDGYRVGVRIITLARDGALRVPIGAVFPRTTDEAVASDHDAGNKSASKDTDEEKTNIEKMTVFVAGENRAVLTPVDVGGRNGTEAWIVSGLKAGDQVIVYPGDAVNDGVRIAPRTVATKP